MLVPVLSEPGHCFTSLCVAGLHGAMPAPKEEPLDEEYSYEDDLEGEESESAKSNTTILPMAQPETQNMRPAPSAAPVSRSLARGRSARSKSCRDKDRARSSRKKDRTRSGRRRNKRRSRSRRRQKDDHKVKRDRQRRRKEHKHRSEEDRRRSRIRRRQERHHVKSQARGIRLREREQAPSTPRSEVGKLCFQCQHCSRRFGSEHALEQHQWSSQYCAQKQGKGKPRQQCACGSWITDEPRAWQQHYNASPGCNPSNKAKHIEGKQPPPLPQLLPSSTASSSAAAGTLPALSSLFLSLSHLTSGENRGQ